jgi:hypothetical protein
MNLILSIIVLVVLVVIAFAIARFVLKLAGKAVGCIVTSLLAVGILVILWLFVF